MKQRPPDCLPLLVSLALLTPGACSGRCDSATTWYILVPFWSLLLLTAGVPQRTTDIADIFSAH